MILIFPAWGAVEASRVPVGIDDPSPPVPFPEFLNGHLFHPAHLVRIVSAVRNYHLLRRLIVGKISPTVSRFITQTYFEKRIASETHIDPPATLNGDKAVRELRTILCAV